MSTRLLTDEQFADGTTIDGNRLDRALDGLGRRINRVRLRDLAVRHVQTQYVAGYLPDVRAAQDSIPWMAAGNVASEVVSGVAPDDGFQNPQRVKGYYQHTDCDHYVWEFPLYFRRPVIVADVFVGLFIDSTYTNDFTYAAAPNNPTAKTALDSASDVSVVLSVDNPLRTEDRGLAAPDLARHWWRATAERFNHANESVAMVAGVDYADMSPSFPGGVLRGVTVNLRDLNVPLHRDTRARLAVVLPHWDGDLAPWGAEPWRLQYYSVVLTVLEEVEEG